MISKKRPLNHEDIQALTKRSNAQALVMLSANWGLIAAAFALAAIWPNPLTVIAAVLIIGGRQLGLAVLVHECSHYSFFTSRKVNIFVGRWLCAWPVHLSYDEYRAGHLGHHAHAGTVKDPDVKLIQAYPVPKDSLRRKLIRDITGQTATRDFKSLWVRSNTRRRISIVLVPVILGVVLSAFGALWTLSLWYLAFFTVLPMYSRIRLIGEHGIAPDRLHKDARLNTSTVRPNLVERLFIAPNNVSLHVEHHLLATVPAYRLKTLHKILWDRGYYQGYNSVASGYREVLRRAVRPSS